MHYICIYFIQYAFCRYNKLIVLNWLTRRGFLLNKKKLKKIRLNARFLIHKHRLINFCWFFFFIVENFLKICTYRPKVSVHSSWKFKHFDCKYCMSLRLHSIPIRFIRCHFNLSFSGKKSEFFYFHLWIYLKSNFLCILEFLETV